MKPWKRYPGLIIGAAILSFGLYNVHSQCQITEGGVLGMTLFLQHWFGITPAVSEPVMDICCYLLAAYFFGWSFIRYAFVASCGFSFFYSIYERMGPVLPNMSDMPLLAAIVGGCFVGVGVGLVVQCGGASGGDDALALVIEKLTGWNISKAYLITDLVVLALSATYIPLVKIGCSLITVMLSSWIIGKIHRNPAEKGLKHKP